MKILILNSNSRTANDFLNLNLKSLKIMINTITTPGKFWNLAAKFFVRRKAKIPIVEQGRNLVLH